MIFSASEAWPAPSAGPARPEQKGLDRAVWTTLAVSLCIAALLQFDGNVAALTGSSRAGEMLAFAAMVVTGSVLGRRAGLRLEGHGTARPVLLGVGAAILVGFYVIILDSLIFRHLLPDYYVALYHEPLSFRLSYFPLRAFNENVIYRLFVFSTVVWAVTRLHGGRRLPMAMVVGLGIAVQLTNIGPNVMASLDAPLTLEMLVYDGLRYIAPGTLWAVLYARNGFLVAEIASVGCHFIIQPVLGSVL